MNIELITNPFSVRGRKHLSPLPGDTVGEVIDSRYHAGYQIYLNSRPARLDQPVTDSDTVTIVKRVDGIAAAVVGAKFASLGILGAMAVTYASHKYLMPKIASWLSGSVKPAMASGNDAAASSQTYGWDGITSMSNAGIPVPIIYGRHRTGGNFINAYISQVDEKSILNVLVAIGEGEVQSIGGMTKAHYASHTASGKFLDVDDISDVIGSKIKIDGNPVSDYRGVELAFRFGEDVQKIIPGFERLHHLRSFNNQIYKDVPQVYTTETDDTEGITLSFECPQLVKYNDDGGTSSAEVSVAIEYRSYNPDDDTGEWTAHGTLVMKEKKLTPVRRQYSIANLGPGAYQIRITRTSKDTSTKVSANLFLKQIDEIRYEALTYPKTAMIALKIEATDQLSGSLPDLSIDVEGRLVRCWDADTSAWVTKWTRNPIWNVVDLITDAHYGLGDFIADADLDLEGLKAAAAYCDELVPTYGSETSTEARWCLDCVIDTTQKALDLLTSLCSTFAAWPVFDNETISIVMDKAETPGDVFGMGNIVRESFTMEYAPISSTINRVEVQFFDETNDNERDTVPVEVEGIYENGDEIVTKTVAAIGVVRRSQAVRLATHILRDAQQNIRSCRIKCGLDAANNFPGSVVRVSHDKPAWGVASGRIASSAAGWFAVNKEIVLTPLAAGESHVVRVTHSDDSEEELTITSAPGTYAANAHIAVSGSWAKTPVAYDVFSIGKAGINGKPFRVVSVSTPGDASTVMLDLREYNASVYAALDQPTDPLEYTNMPNPMALCGIVLALTATNTNDYSRRILLGFQSPVYQAGQGYFDHVEFWVSTESWTDMATFHRVPGESKGEPFEFQNAVPGRAYWFRAVSVSTFGAKTALADSPMVSIVAKASSPPNVTGLELIGQGNDHLFKGKSPSFTWKESSLATAVHPAGQEPYGAGTGSRDSYFDHYVVEIYSRSVDNGVKDINTLRRSVIVHDNKYTYSFDDNLTDHQKLADQGLVPHGYASRHLMVLVYAVDIYNQRSAVPAGMYADNAQEKWNRVITSPTSVIPVTPSISSYYVNSITSGVANITLGWDPLLSIDENGTMTYPEDTENPWEGKALVSDPGDLREFRLYVCGPYDSWEAARQHAYSHNVGTMYSSPVIGDTKSIYRGPLPYCTVNLLAGKTYVMFAVPVDAFWENETLDLTLNLEDSAVFTVPDHVGNQ